MFLMYNLKRGRGTYKGIIGECLFKITRKYLILTKFFNKNKYLEIFGKNFTEIEKKFIKENWYSLDSIEISFSKNKKVTLFEIKTLNDFYYKKIGGINRLPIFTESTIQIYKKALELGFDVKVAIIWLKKDWDYDIEIIDFDKCKYLIDSPKKYDKN